MKNFKKTLTDVSMKHIIRNIHSVSLKHYLIKGGLSMAIKKDEKIFLELIRDLKYTNPLELRELKGIMIGLKMSNVKKQNMSSIK
jgi:hypothetical protein